MCDLHKSSPVCPTDIVRVFLDVEVTPDNNLDSMKYKDSLIFWFCVNITDLDTFNLSKPVTVQFVSLYKLSASYRHLASPMERHICHMLRHGIMCCQQALCNVNRPLCAVERPLCDVNGP